jgi:2-oxoisovalerate dehydrogenase E1 component
LEEDRKNDPIPKFEDYLIREKIFNEKDIELLKNHTKKEIDQAAEAMDKMEHPDPDTVHDYLFAPKEEKTDLKYRTDPGSGDRIVMVDAINHALKEEMSRDEQILLFGQDVADGKGGVFTATSGISSMFGAERCFNAPLAESSIVGVATGLAVRGLKPVVEIQFGDYIWTAMMQIRNELSTIRWRSNNNWACPVIIRVPVGGYIHGGLCHSQNIEAFFSHIPGLHILYPSQADDAKGLLKSAIRGNDPVLFLEHKGLYRQSYAATSEPDEDYLVPIGKGIIRRDGSDVTIVTYGALVQKSLEAARILSKEGFEVEVIDIRTIAPLDTHLIQKSVKKTNKVLVTHEDSQFQGFGAEIAAQIAEFSFEHLDAPVQRLGGKDLPVGFSPVLEDNTLPQNKDVLEKLRQLVQY